MTDHMPPHPDGSHEAAQVRPGLHPVGEHDKPGEIPAIPEDVDHRIAVARDARRYQNPRQYYPRFGQLIKQLRIDKDDLIFIANNVSVEHEHYYRAKIAEIDAVLKPRRPPVQGREG